MHCAKLTTIFILALTCSTIAAQPLTVPTAVRVTDQPLIHTDQILGSNFDRMLDRIVAEFHLDRIIKLNIVGVDAAALEAAEAGLVRRYPNHRPAVLMVCGALPDPAARWAVDAVGVGSARSTDRLIPRGLLRPGPRVYISGQAERGSTPTEATRATLASLQRTLDWLGCTRADIVQCKTFIKPIQAVAEVRREFEVFFGSDRVPPLVFVEWESSLPVEIELIAAAPRSAADSGATSGTNPPAPAAIEYLTPPGLAASPIFCRVTRVNAATTIYTDGLTARQAGDGRHEVSDVFEQLRTVLAEHGSDWNHLAKATYYVSGEDASRKLNELRPQYYDPRRPPAASKAQVAGVARRDRTFTMDMIAVPAVKPPVGAAP